MKQYVVDAFSDTVFGGNPAAICVMDSWLPDALMQQISMENNLSESAFAVRQGEKYHLRWFTPAAEIDLCGHATLACAYCIMRFIDTTAVKVVFTTLSGDLTVIKKGDLYEMDFPAFTLLPVPITPQMVEAMGAAPIEAYMGRDLVCVFAEEATVRQLQPDMDKLRAIDGLLLHVTAHGQDVDCVSRSFAPKLHVAEDPVCGSGHCHIVPYWASRLHKQKIVAYQASRRGGTLYCRMENDSVILGGNAALYAIADINIGL